MVIEHAERFGLSQLHQLRGRVGRGAAPVDVRAAVSAAARRDAGGARLDALVETTDGFVIAERDLALRGPGDFFGRGNPDCRRCASATCSAIIADGGRAPRSRRVARRRTRRRSRSSSTCRRTGPRGSAWWGGVIGVCGI